MREDMLGGRETLLPHHLEGLEVGVDSMHSVDPVLFPDHPFTLVLLSLMTTDPVEVSFLLRDPLVEEELSPVTEDGLYLIRCLVELPLPRVSYETLQSHVLLNPLCRERRRLTFIRETDPLPDVSQIGSYLKVPSRRQLPIGGGARY